MDFDTFDICTWLFLLWQASSLMHATICPILDHLIPTIFALLESISQYDTWFKAIVTLFIVIVTCFE